MDNGKTHMKSKFFRIHIKRELEFTLPYKLGREVHDDWTHFAHLHRKSILEYRLLYKRGQREIFLYKGRRLYPLPFYDTYIVFRNYDGSGYRNVYLNAKTGQMHFLAGQAIPKGDNTVTIGEYVFEMPRYWRFFPKLFFNLFLKRAHKLLEEDNQWQAERIALGTEEGKDSPCAPVVPEFYDLFDDFFGNGKMPESDVSFQEASFYDLKNYKTTKGSRA